MPVWVIERGHTGEGASAMIRLASRGPAHVLLILAKAIDFIQASFPTCIIIPLERPRRSELNWPSAINPCVVSCRSL